MSATIAFALFLAIYGFAAAVVGWSLCLAAKRREPTLPPANRIEPRLNGRNEITIRPKRNENLN